MKKISYYVNELGNRIKMNSIKLHNYHYLEMLDMFSKIVDRLK